MHQLANKCLFRAWDFRSRNCGFKNFLELLVFRDEIHPRVSGEVTSCNVVLVFSALEKFALQKESKVLLHLFRVKIASVHDPCLDRAFYALGKYQPDNFDPTAFSLA